jgi:hypothetical protein
MALEPRSLGRRIGAAHRRVVELIDDTVERRDGRTLPQRRMHQFPRL